MHSWSQCGSILLAVLLPSVAAAQEVGQVVIQQEPAAEDLYLAGARVQIQAPVTGDVIAAGGTVSVEAQVTQDVIAAGGSVDVQGPVLDDVRAAGGEVRVRGEVGGDAALAGGHVRLAKGASVKGRAWLAGADVDVAGSVGGNLRVAAGNATISGQVEGNADLSVGNLVVLPGARIAGNLTYRSPREARIDPGAEISGTIEYVPVQRPGPMARFAPIAVLAFVLVSLLITGFAMYLLAPRFTLRATRTVASDPLKSLGLGLAWLVAAPFAASLLMATVLGIPLGLAVTALYLVSLLAGLLLAAFFLGDLLFYPLRRRSELSTGLRVLSLAIGLVLLAATGFLPTPAQLIGLVLFLFGLGALVLAAQRARAPVPPPPAAVAAAEPLA